MPSDIRSKRSYDSERLPLGGSNQGSDWMIYGRNILGRRKGLTALVTLIALVGLGTLIVIVVDDCARGRSTCFSEVSRDVSGARFLPYMYSRDESIPVDTLLAFAEHRLATRVSTYDIHGSIYDDHNVQFKYPTLHKYREAMLKAWEYWFEPDGVYSQQERSTFDSQRDLVMSHLRLTGAEELDDKLPKDIYTTSKGIQPDYADQFRSWFDLNPDWQFRNYNDDDTSDWLNTTFRIGGEKSTTFARVVSGFDSLDRGVLKGDIFRYLALFLNGGVYTDTDTSAVRSLADWPGLWSGKDIKKISGDPMLDTLSEILQLAYHEQGTASANAERAATLRLSPEALYAQSKPPRLIVAIETDSLTTRADWRAHQMARGFQFCQWTIAARPHHPVFLDVISYALKMAEAQRLGIAEQKRVLDMTGPGSWTDALFNYLLVRWGVTPEQLTGIAEAVQVGDVLIYPPISFHADASEGYQGTWALVWHGFFGRWRGEILRETAGSVKGLYFNPLRNKIGDYLLTDDDDPAKNE